MKIFSARNVTAVGLLLVFLNLLIYFVEGTNFNPEGLRSAMVKALPISGMKIPPGYPRVDQLNNSWNPVLSQLYNSSPNTVVGFQNVWGSSTGNTDIAIDLYSLPNQSDAVRVFQESITLIRNDRSIQLSGFDCSGVPGASGFNMSSKFQEVKPSQTIGFSVGRFLIVVFMVNSNVATIKGQEAELVLVAQDEYRVADHTLPTISLSTKNSIPRDLAMLLTIFLIAFTAIRVAYSRSGPSSHFHPAKLPASAETHIYHHGDSGVGNYSDHEVVGDH